MNHFFLKSFQFDTFKVSYCTLSLIRWFLCVCVRSITSKYIVFRLEDSILSFFFGENLKNNNNLPEHDLVIHRMCWYQLCWYQLSYQMFFEIVLMHFVQFL